MSMPLSAECLCSHSVDCNHECHGRHCDPTEHVCSIEFLPDEGGLAPWGLRRLHARPGSAACRGMRGGRSAASSPGTQRSEELRQALGRADRAVLRSRRSAGPAWPRTRPRSPRRVARSRSSASSLASSRSVAVLRFDDDDRRSWPRTDSDADRWFDLVTRREPALLRCDVLRRAALAIVGPPSKPDAQQISGQHDEDDDEDDRDDQPDRTQRPAQPGGDHREHRDDEQQPQGVRRGPHALTIAAGGPARRRRLSSAPCPV